MIFKKSHTRRTCTPLLTQGLGKATEGTSSNGKVDEETWVPFVVRARGLGHINTDLTITRGTGDTGKGADYEIIVGPDSPDLLVIGGGGDHGVLDAIGAIGGDALCLRVQGEVASVGGVDTTVIPDGPSITLAFPMTIDTGPFADMIGEGRVGGVGGRDQTKGGGILVVLVDKGAKTSSRRDQRGDIVGGGSGVGGKDRRVQAVGGNGALTRGGAYIVARGLQGEGRGMKGSKGKKGQGAGGRVKHDSGQGGYMERGRINDEAVRQLVHLPPRPTDMEEEEEEDGRHVQPLTWDKHVGEGENVTREGEEGWLEQEVERPYERAKGRGRRGRERKNVNK